MGARVINKKDSWLMRLIGRFSPTFMRFFWTTYRLPFQKQATIACPAGIEDPLDDKHDKVIAHEMVHVKQLEPWYGPFLMLFLYFLFPLPVFFSGRWFVEREAYLVDIKNGRVGLGSAVDILWLAYFYCWPKSLMRKWFEKRVNV